MSMGNHGDNYHDDIHVTGIDGEFLRLLASDTSFTSLTVHGAAMHCSEVS